MCRIVIFIVVALSVNSAFADRPNILLLTADDMSYESLGLTGCPLPDLSPNLDRLAKAGMLFKYAHVVSTVCGTSRGALHTGRYPHSTGCLGHGEQPPSWWRPRKSIPSISVYLHDHGYFTGIMCKGAGRAIEHVWDFDKQKPDTDVGRSPAKFYKLSSEFFQTAKKDGKPFFFNVNMCDPHKPWARQEGQKWLDKERDHASKIGETIDIPDPGVNYRPGEIPVPPYLIDNTKTREEIAPYFDSVHRMDQCVGEVLRALRETGLTDNTIIVFLSDHGIGTAFAKRSVYYASTHTPLIVVWPNKIKPASVDSQHVVSSVDLVPTLVEAIGLRPLEGIEGRSLMPILEGQQVENWRKQAYCAFNCMNGEEQYWPSRAMTGRRYVYVWNGWVDGKNLAKKVVHGGGGNGEDLFRKRWGDDWELGVKEELYDMEADPGFWTNLIDDPKHQRTLHDMRRSLLAEMTSTEDHETERFQNTIRKKSPAAKQDTYAFPDVANLPIQKGLADPFLMSDGNRVSTVEDWQKQREYLKEMLAHYLYGRMPPRPKNFEVKQVGSKEIYEGTGVEEKYRLTIRRNGKSVTCDFLVVRPALKKRYPTVIKNDRVSFDASVEDRPSSDNFDPGIEAVKRGYLLCRFNRTDLAPDDRTNSSNWKEHREAGVYALYPEYDWGALAVWGWGHGLVLDALDQLGLADMNKVVATGHSRGGKAALCAGIYDDRVTITAPNSSGTGGTGSLRYFEEGQRPQTIKHHIGKNQHWFNPRYFQFADKEDRLPFDSHFAKAAVAPRALVNCHARQDYWANPYGTELTHRAAEVVYQWLDAGDRIGLHWREGTHAQNQEDWAALLDFADRRLFDKKTDRKFNNVTYPNAELPFDWKAPDTEAGK